MRKHFEELLVEEPFEPVRLPASIQLPDEKLDGPPLLITEPRPRRTIVIPLAGFVLSLALHGTLLYFLATARYEGLALLVPQGLKDASQKTLRLVFVQQPKTPPPTQPVKTLRASDQDREARGGEIKEGMKKGPDPRLHGNSPERIYDPGKGSQSAGLPRREDPNDATGADEQRGHRETPMAAGLAPAATTTPKLDRSKDELANAASLPKYRAIGDEGLFHGSGEVAELDGGSGAEGSVSFETSWFDWGDYATSMLRRIKWNWIPPHALYIGVKGHVRVSFVIQKSGDITDVTLEQTSGTSSYDEAAMAAIAASSPLSPLPENFPFAHEKVTINFLYNMNRVAANREGEPPAGSGS